MLCNGRHLCLISPPTLGGWAKAFPAPRRERKDEQRATVFGCRYRFLIWGQVNLRRQSGDRGHAGEVTDALNAHFQDMAARGMGWTC